MLPIRRPLFTLTLVILLSTWQALADELELTPDHPQRYTVVKGDTLWDISSRFLKSPWFWPRIWKINEQIDNPHLIYPGDVVVLRYVDGKPELVVLRNEKLPVVTQLPQEDEPQVEETIIDDKTVKWSPKVRSRPLEEAIPTITPDAIVPFLRETMVVSKNELERAGYITIGMDNRIALGNASKFYARGLGENEQEYYHIFRPGKVLRHPDSKEILGYEAIYLGSAKMVEPGDPAKMVITSVKQEIIPRDRLLAAPPRASLPYYYPRPPKIDVEGRILTAFNALSEVGPGTVVTISLGEREGMEEGHVLRVMRHIGSHKDPITRKRYALPDEESGLIMVFRTFEKVSYALVMQANYPIHIRDAVTTP